jgi:DNA-binding MarR family transcriptional regulator
MKDFEDDHRALRFLDEISKDGLITQRDLSDRVGVALGLVNSYMKNLAAKGYVKVSAIPRKRYRYYLTPKGFVEKSRLTYAMLHNYTRVFKEARRDYAGLFQKLYASGVRRVLFAGVDEVAEIAYLSLHEVGLEFVGAVDYERPGTDFFRFTVKSFEELKEMPDAGHVVITTYHRKDAVYNRLVEAGVADGHVHSIYPIAARPGGRK